MTKKITERELQQLFAGQKINKGSSPLKWALVFVAIFAAILVIINLPAFSSNFDYWFSTQFQNTSFENPTLNQVIDNKKPVSDLLSIIPKNSIYIDKLNIKAPITFDVPNETAAVAANLQNGAIQIEGTAHPGEIGNVFITGHSSNYVWAKGSYNHVFSRLPDLEVNDYVTVNYNNIIYIYQVSDKYVTSATAIGNLKQTDRSELTLMTCYPVGTNLNRLIIKGIQIKPDPSVNQKKAPSTLDNLPDIKR
jgi:sortase A